jgi:hypothetical protein
VKRRPIKLGMLALALLLGGAIVNVAVAWGCAACINPLSNSCADFYGKGVSKANVAWSYWVTKRPGIVFVQGVADAVTERVSSTTTNLFQTHVPSWSRLHLESDLEWTIAIEDGRGWPSIALCSETNMVMLPSGGHSGTVQFGIATRRTGDPRLYRVMPLRPIWAGFAINTIFYAAILWGMFALPLALRRRRRVKRGLCPACGYDLRGSASQNCPECGAAIPRVMPRDTITP